jgi:hypothetical protein
MLTSNQIVKAIVLLPKTNLILPEFLALLTDIKPVITHNLNQNEARLIKDNFPELYIACRILFMGEKRLPLCALSKNKSFAEKTIDLFCTKKIDMELIGKLLGYPQCCVRSYLKFINNNQQYNSSFVTYKAYKNSQKYSYYCNNLLNFSSRVDDSKISNYQHYELNNNPPFPLRYFQYISHIPCQYDCPKSIRIGKETSALLQKYIPKVEKTIKNTLSRPILFFDIFKLIIFDGDLRKGVLHYQKVLPPFFLIDSTLMDFINNGNQIVINKNKITIMKNNSTLYVYRKKSETDGFILNFRSS